jgi:hydrogenase-4 component F
MMINGIMLAGILCTLVTGVALCTSRLSAQRILRIPVATAIMVTLLTAPLALRLFTGGAFALFGRNILIDHLSLYHVILVNLVFLAAAVYATGYFKHGIKTGALTLSYIRRYCMLWQTFHAILLVVLVSNNIGIMWVALEATTLVSAFLIVSDTDALSIEAMWKYLLICSVGIVFAFMGTILTVAAAKEIHGADSLFLFSQLRLHADLINPQLMLLAFIFIVVGFGTKAGLAPMHTWLPDAHSQSPTPVSAVFSGVMLNCALFCIMRYLPITEAALGHDGQAHSILLLFGFLSLVFAVIFIPIQRDMKRFLAYCSVEHIGIIAIGLGIGGLGAFAALLHTFNHSIAKMLSFFAAGRIGEQYGTRDMRVITGAVRRTPLWGTAFLISVLALIGVAPFSLFLSEFLIIKESFFRGKYVVAGLFIFCLLAVFISALKHVMGVSYGADPGIPTTAAKSRFADRVIVAVCIIALIVLGLWIPAPLGAFLTGAAAVIENGIGL